MYEIHSRSADQAVKPIHDYLSLDYAQREKCRFKAVSTAGVETRVFLERGVGPLALGEVLRTECGKNIAITGAAESLAVATCDDWTTFSKACYHLGNRHVRIEVFDRRLRIKPDHVLEDMLKLLGLEVTHEEAVFEPETGAYHGGAHGGHGSSHGHSHDDAQEREIHAHGHHHH